ncbi:hypothetical protein BKA69DRAFT_1041472 [Paraphysoderma sedebokerense]|nr:hypothetical protein BKA69DRAFT_868036 [Paraphysoderma sedebokerense]KAI9137767.1 hypothetical protein BKA69DRAFT_1041472 [Paraphysoderma sedebokerense]
MLFALLGLNILLPSDISPSVVSSVEMFHIPVISTEPNSRPPLTPPGAASHTPPSSPEGRGSSNAFESSPSGLSVELSFVEISTGEYTPDYLYPSDVEIASASTNSEQVDMSEENGATSDPSGPEVEEIQTQDHNATGRPTTSRQSLLVEEIFVAKLRPLSAVMAERDIGAKAGEDSAIGSETKLSNTPIIEEPLGQGKKNESSYGQSDKVESSKKQRSKKGLFQFWKKSDEKDCIDPEEEYNRRMAASRERRRSKSDSWKWTGFNLR